MTTVQKVYACIADAVIRNVGDLGAGRHDRSAIGLHGGAIYRTVEKYGEPDWAAEGVIRIISATLRHVNSSGSLVTRGATPRALIKRLTTGWQPGTSAVLSPTNGGGTRWDVQPGTTVTGMTDTGTLPTANSAVVEEDVTAIVRAYAPLTVEGGGGLKNNGFGWHSFDEGSAARTTEFYSNDHPTAAVRPTLTIVFETNTAPSAPIDLVPGVDDGAAVVALITRPDNAEPTLRFAGTRVDPDPGDYITGVHVQIYADSATDAVPGTPIIDQAPFAFTGVPISYDLAVPIFGLLAPGTTYRSRVRTRDRDNAWGDWSSLTASRFKPNTPPAEPSNLAVDPATQTPNFYGTLVDQDPGATIGEVQIEVFQDTPLGAVEKWAPDWIDSGGTRFVIAYGGGQVIEFAVPLRWRARIKDNLGTEGPWSAWQFWTPQELIVAPPPGQPAPPDNMTPRSVEAKLNTLTPTLTLAHSVAFDAHTVQVARYPDETDLLLYTSITHPSTTSWGVTYNAGAANQYPAKSLDWGNTYYWRAQIRVSAIWSEWSPWFPFYINALPLKPYVSIDGAVPVTTWQGSYVTTTSLQPTIRSPFRDPDKDKGYVEAPTSKFIVILDRTLGVEVASYWPGGANHSDPTLADSHVVAAGALVMERTYAVTVIFADNANRQSPWSEWTLFKVSAPPVLALVTGPDVADPAPLIDWSFTSPSGKAQSAFQLRVLDDATDTEVHDSGVVVTGATEYVIPGGILENGVTYRAHVYAVDTDQIGPPDVLPIAPWTTAFTAPVVLTGLTATPDLDASDIDLAWDVTALSPSHFWRYYIFRRSEDTGEFVRIGEVADRSAPVFSDREAPHGVPVDYAVTVSNGWAESPHDLVTAVLGLGWWLTTPVEAGLTFELRYVADGGFREGHEQDQETHKALGRAFPIVITGELLAPSGMLTLEVLPEDRDIWTRLQRAAKVDPYVIIKSPYGLVLRVRLGSIGRAPRGPGIQTVSVEYQAVA